MLGLAFESSCDETGIALVEADENGRLSLVSNFIFSQIDLHARYGGVVPEVASRAHLEKIPLMLNDARNALAERGLEFSDIDFVAATNRPGLVGSLMLGFHCAKVISLNYGIPLVPVNHLEAHLRVKPIDETAEGSDIEFPCLGLLISGGNTVIYIYHGTGRLEVIGNTLDDAIGEAFDKAAKLMGLPYPGGVHVDRIASQYTPAKKEKPVFPRILSDQPADRLNFSYSGIKTAMMRYLQRLEQTPDDQTVARLCYWFQERCFEIVMRNLKNAVKKTGLKTVVCGGGVTANSLFRRLVSEWQQSEEEIDVYYPGKMSLCTDNAAMISSLGYYLHQAKLHGDLKTAVSSRA